MRGSTRRQRLGDENAKVMQQTYTALEMYGYLFGVLVLCSTYGGVHLAAWNFQFPSEIENQLWKGTSYCLQEVASAYSCALASCITSVCGSFVVPVWIFLAGIMAYVIDTNEPQTFIRSVAATLGGLRAQIHSWRTMFGFNILSLIISIMLTSIVMTPIFLFTYGYLHSIVFEFESGSCGCVSGSGVDKLSSSCLRCPI
jgi:hypothetical protein